MEGLQQPVLHVEARVKSSSDGIIVRTDLVLRFCTSQQLAKILSQGNHRSGMRSHNG
jgi:hypothetical protein